MRPSAATGKSGRSEGRRLVSDDETRVDPTQNPLAFVMLADFTVALCEMLAPDEIELVGELRLVLEAAKADRLRRYQVTPESVPLSLAIAEASVLGGLHAGAAVWTDQLAVVAARRLD